MKMLKQLSIPLCIALTACSDGGDSGGSSAPEPMNSAPMISGLMNQSIEADTADQALTFSVTDDSTPAADLAVSATSGDASLIADSGLVLAGDGQNRRLEITPQPNQVGSVEVTLRVVDAMNAATEQIVTVTIEPRQVAFSGYVRTIFRTDASARPLPVNSVMFSRDGTDFNDLLL